MEVVLAVVVCMLEGVVAVCKLEVAVEVAVVVLVECKLAVEVVAGR